MFTQSAYVSFDFLIRYFFKVFQVFICRLFSDVNFKHSFFFNYFFALSLRKNWSLEIRNKWKVFSETKNSFKNWEAANWLKMLAKLISRKGRYHRIQKLPWLKRMISFFFWKVLGMGGKTYKKVVLQNFEIWTVVKNLEKMKFAKEKNLGNL